MNLYNVPVVVSFWDGDVFIIFAYIGYMMDPTEKLLYTLTVLASISTILTFFSTILTFFNVRSHIGKLWRWFVVFCNTPVSRLVVAVDKHTRSRADCEDNLKQITIDGLVVVFRPCPADNGSQGANKFYLAECPVTIREFSQFIRERDNYVTSAEEDKYDGLLRGAWVLSNNGESWVEKEEYSWRNPGFKQRDNHPVVCISHKEANAYIDWLNEKFSNFEEGCTATFRLPTGKEWECACQAGTKTKYFWGDAVEGGKNYLNAAGTENDLFGNSRPVHFPFICFYPATSPVRRFKANPWGFYDMLGNVWEWTSSSNDRKDNNCRYELRGGMWNNGPGYCTCKHRRFDVEDARSAAYGFRVAFDLKKKE